jgi:hypothetical protein
MMALLRLRDDYTPDGRVLGEIFKPSALPPGMRGHRSELQLLGEVYTQLEAPVGTFGLDTLRASTRALASRSHDDATYTRIENQLEHLGDRRNDVAGQMHALLLGAAFDGRSPNERKAAKLIREGIEVLGTAVILAQ